MSEPLQVRLAGYSPAGSTHSRALDAVAERLRAQTDLALEVEIDYNVLDRGGSIEELLAAVEMGALTACYFSTSYLADRVPELSLIDLPFVFDSLEHAHACLDGELGQTLSAPTRAATRLVPLGYWDNGMRHLSNRIAPIRSAADCRGLRTRLQPNWAHERFFTELGACPVLVELRDGIELIVRGEVDAQENPLANFVAYGVDRVHPYLTLTGHAYGARGFYASALQLARWPEQGREALATAVTAAVATQRRAAAARENELQAELGLGGTQIVELDPEGLESFRAAAAPVLAEARSRLDPELFALLKR